VRWVILGGGGQLGQEFARRLPGAGFALTRGEADLTLPASVRTVLTQFCPEVVFNCAAYNLVDRAEQEPETALAINGTGVGELATVCEELGCPLIHFSTDHVFGLRACRTPFTEDDLPQPLNAYGQSKREGELHLLSHQRLRFLLIRTCGLYGAWGSGGKGGNFVETVLRLASEGRALRVVDDQVCTPTSAADLAEATLALLRREAWGVHHVTNDGSCSWYEFACKALDLAGLRIPVEPIPTAELRQPARRPPYSVLRSKATRSLGLCPHRPWTEALAAYFDDRRGAKSPRLL
jgi:dTDP-4-dehydrorhamnose reductase